jgi:hypothetical protein
MGHPILRSWCTGRKGATTTKDRRSGMWHMALGILVAVKFRDQGGYSEGALCKVGLDLGRGHLTSLLGIAHAVWRSMLMGLPKRIRWTNVRQRCELQL